MQSNEKPLKAVIESMLEAYQLKAKINEVRIINEWEKAVGPIVSQNTEKLYVRRGKLYVYLTSSVIKNELVFARQQIIQRLNEAIGEEVITELVVK
jgi:predicted nucleic acid-binding Zn ribbon protein